MLATPTTPGFQSLGQQTSRTIALRAAAGHRLGRTFLVHGPAGAGKGVFVDDLLALLFCAAPPGTERPCNACAGCRGARSRSHPDLVLGSPERWRELRGTGESVVAVARRWLADAAGAPIAGSRRVVLIEGADRAGEPIQNALLKGLEEPGDRHVFVLVADEMSQLLPTIRSRCQLLRVGPVPRAELVRWLVEEHRLEPAEADALARIAGGLTGRALAYAEDRAARDWRTSTQHELLQLLDAGRAKRLGSARDLLDAATRGVGSMPSGADPPPADGDGGEPVRTPTSLQRSGATALVGIWIALARDLLVVAAGRPEAAAAQELLPDLTRAARSVGVEPVSAFIALLERIHAGLEQNASPRLALDVAMLGWPTAVRA